MDKFVRSLLTEWRRSGLPLAGENYLVAVSGGADSVALLLALADLSRRKKLGHRLTVAHFDHQLRGAESARDADFVRALSAELDLAFVSEKGIVARRGNLEQNARRARYGFLRRAAVEQNASGILTAHTVNDQAETLLLNLIRGSGLAGLAGMEPVVENFTLRSDGEESPQSAVRGPVSEDRRPKTEDRKPKTENRGFSLIRPLLNWALREDTEAFCRRRGVEPRRDAMNEDENFARVRVRKRLLPLLAEFNPRIASTLAQTARLLRGELALVDEATPETPFRAEAEIPLGALRNLSEAALYRGLRAWLAARRGDLRGLDRRHLEAVRRLALSPKSGRVVELPGGAAVVKRAGRLIYLPEKH